MRSGYNAEIVNYFHVHPPNIFKALQIVKNSEKSLIGKEMCVPKKYITIMVN